MILKTNRENDESSQGRADNIIRIGEVTSVDYSKLTARVTFDDDDGVTSYDLPILQPNTLENRDYTGLDVGEDVVCVFLPTGQEEGFILGSVYAGDVTPPYSDKNIRGVKFSDDTEVKYNRSSHELNVKNGQTEIIANRDRIELKAPQILLTISGTTMTFDGSSCSLSASNFNFKGHMNVTGGITASDDIHAPNIN